MHCNVWHHRVRSNVVQCNMMRINDSPVHPKLAILPYRTATVDRGDCIFIPGDYPHHVVSPAPSAAAAATAAAAPTAASSVTPSAPAGTAPTRKQEPTEKARNLQVSFLFSGPTAYARGTPREVPAVAWESSGETVRGCAGESLASTGSTGSSGGEAGAGAGAGADVDGSCASAGARWSLSEHPVSWVYPGTGRCRHCVCVSLIYHP